MTKQIKIDSITPKRVAVHFERENNWLNNKYMDFYPENNSTIAIDNKDIVVAILDYYLDHKDDTIDYYGYPREFNKDGLPVLMNKPTPVVIEWLKKHYWHKCDAVRPVYYIQGKDQVVTIGHKYKGSCIVMIYNLKD